MNLVLTRLLRLSELSPAILACVSLFGFIGSFFARDFGITYDERVIKGASTIGFIASALALMPIVIRDLNIWRLFPPKYQGSQEYLNKLRGGARFSDAVFIGSDGKTRVDSLLFLKSLRPLLDQISLVAENAALQEISAEMNVRAFSGTKYDQSVARKRERNGAISSKHFASFALLGKSERHSDYCGLSSVVPLNKWSVASYLAGQIADNDLEAVSVAAPKDDIGAIVFFLIANLPNENRVGSRSLSSATLEQLVLCSVVQSILIAMTARPGDNMHLAVSVNSETSMLNLFLVLGLDRRKEFSSADQQKVFATEVVYKNLKDAKAYLLNEKPEWKRYLA